MCRAMSATRPAAIYKIIAAGAESFEQGLLAFAAADGDQRNIRRFRIGAKNRRDFERVHFAQVRGAEDGRGSIPFEHRQRIGRLRAGDHVEALQLQRIAQPLGEIDVALDHQNLRKTDRARSREWPQFHRTRSRWCARCSYQLLKIENFDRLFADGQHACHVLRRIFRRRK